MDAATLEKYYVKEAIKTGERLARAVRTGNEMPLPPKCGAEVVEMPVYEPLNQVRKATLHSFTNSMCPIEIIRVAREPRYVDAFFRRYSQEEGQPDRAEIVVAQTNTCMTRFLVCKEMMHAHIEDVDTYTSTPSELRKLIMGLIAEDTDLTPQTAADEAAWFGAVQYLIPDGYVKYLKKMYELACENELTKDRPYYYLALRLRIPEILVEFRLNEEEIFDAVLDEMGPSM